MNSEIQMPCHDAFEIYVGVLTTRASTVQTL